MRKGTAKATAGARAATPGVVAVEILHPIQYLDSEYSRGLHYLDHDVAEFFLGLRVPDRVHGPQPVARLPLPVEAPKRGVVMCLPVGE